MMMDSSTWPTAARTPSGSSRLWFPSNQSLKMPRVNNRRQATVYILVCLAVEVFIFRNQEKHIRMF
jgi:hypothetical protein